MKLNAIYLAAFVGLLSAIAPSRAAAVDTQVTPLPSPSISAPQPTLVPTAEPLPAPTTATPAPPVLAPTPGIAAPTPVPLTLIPNSVVVAFGSNVVVQATGVYGAFEASSSDMHVAQPVASQDTRQIIIMGKGLGSALITVKDSRGETAVMSVSVLMPAGRVAPSTSIRVTGAPASALFLAEEAANAAVAAASPNTGAVVSVAPNAVIARDLDTDGLSDISVPVSIRGRGLYPIDAVTHVRVENFAQPHVRPTSLLVSDFPEMLREDGLLYTANLQPDEAIRLLFYHASPAKQPNRYIVLQATNPGTQDAVVSIISSHGGPNANEMQVGHLATQRFLVREAQNEGVLVTVPAKSTVALVSRSLPAGMVVNDILQLHAVSGPALQLALSSQQTSQANADLNANAALLTDTVSHARGRYPIPEFFYEATYDTSNPQLEIPIGQVPIPNLREGVALAGDYGVLFSINATLSNTSAQPVEVALYATPRGGRATGTYIIDRALVQTHALPSYSHYKLKQYTVPAHGFVNVNVVTMPEGGSSYPLNLVFAPDDGSVSPGGPGSPVY